MSPTFPYDSITNGVTDPPEGTTWNDISYVIGGFGWKAQFIDQNGYILTGDEDAPTQYNFAHEKLEIPAGWVAFEAGEENLPFDCGECHTTGYAPQGHQAGKEGIAGTWEFPGTQCERCHGPGSRHADDPRGVRMDVDRSSQLCGDCHLRDDPAVIEANNGFETNFQQYDDLFNSKHFALACVTCHDPHASTLYADEELNPKKGIKQACASCHWAKLTQNNRRHGNVECIDCHMPPMAKSAVGDLERFTADLRSHQFSINPDPDAPQFDETGNNTMPYLTLEYACRQCHNGEDYSNQEEAALVEMAAGYHDRATSTPEASPTMEAEEAPEPTATASPSEG
jgi:hypothetical protein